MSQNVTVEQGIAPENDFQPAEMQCGEVAIITRLPLGALRTKLGDPIVKASEGFAFPASMQYADAVYAEQYRCRRLRQGERVIITGK